MKKYYQAPSLHMTAVQHQQHLLTMSGEMSGYSRSSGGFSQDESSGAGGSQTVKNQGNPVDWDE